MWQLHAEVEARPRDVLIDKQLPGSFTNTLLAEFLKERGIDTVCIAGYMTQMCCDTTARQAFHRGYKVEFLRDATGTLDVENQAGSVTAEQLHEAILVSQQMFISEVIDKNTWLQRIG
jgi:nicotinamidase-related amidase